MSSDKDKFDLSKVWNALWQDVLQNKRKAEQITFMLQTIINAPAGNKQIVDKERQIIDDLKNKSISIAGLHWKIKKNPDAHESLVCQPYKTTLGFRIEINKERHYDFRDLDTKVALFDQSGDVININLNEPDRLFFFAVYESTKIKDREVNLNRFKDVI